MTRMGRRDLERLFPGDSELAHRMRAFDWSMSEVGPPELWPENLRVALRICLTSRFPMHVWWGPGLTLFYNDAYVSFLGKGKHPAMLGRSGKEAWAEIWDTIGPMIEAVFTTGNASWSEDILMFFDRDLPREEVYVTFSFSPVLGAGHEVDGLFCACTESTEKLIGARRLGTLHKLAGRTSEARTLAQAGEQVVRVLGENPNDIPFAALYLVDEDGRARLASSTGLSAPERVLPAIAARGHHDEASVWPLGRVLSMETATESGDLTRAAAPLPGGPWPEPARRAMVLPIRAAHDGLAGLLVAGISPRRPLDAAYRSFLDLVAGQIGTALADATVHEEERRRVQALAELDRAKTTFFSNVSHELRTPLTLVLGPLEDVLRGRRVDGDDRDALEVVHRNGMRLLKLVNSLLDFSRIEAGRALATFEPTDLAQLTAELCGVFRSTIERAGLRLVVDCPPLPGDVRIDRDMWEKIVLNLLSNAFKFTFEGEIAVRLREGGGDVTLTVSDTGSGIPKEELPHLFERFHRVLGARSRTHEGTGIGLALVGELVKLHGGDVTVESEVARGTSFHVRVPRDLPASPHRCEGGGRPLSATKIGAAAFVEEAQRWLADDLEEAARSARELPSTGEAHILLADDNADMRSYVKRLLGERWSVEAVADGFAALQAARARRPDLVLTDVMMPRLGGFELLRELRSDPRTSSVPVIILSARAGEESKVAGLASGADDYLVKPFSAKELLARVNTHLTLSRARANTAERLRLLAEASRELGRSLDYDTTVQSVADFAVPALADFCLFDMIDEGGELKRVPSAHALGVAPGWIERARMWTPPLEARSHPIARVLRTGVPAFEPNVDDALLRRYSRSPEHLAFLRESEVRSMICVPVAGRDRLLGALSLFFTVSAGRQHIIDDLRIAEDLGRRAALALENAALHREAIAARTLAEEASRGKDQLLAMLGHELRNPLGAISGAVRILEVAGGTQAARARDIIVRQVGQLAHLVDDLLDAGRVALGKIKLDRRPLDVASTAARLIQTLSATGDLAHEIRLDAHPTWIDADETRIEQLLGNLLGNALKFTPPGGAVRVHVRPEGEEAVVIVDDTGPGIAPETLPHIFDLFFQGDATIERARGGLGIGLTLVKRLTELHGGTVVAASAGRGKGTSFTLRFPRIAAPPAIEPAPARERPRPHGRRILVIEDNDDARETLIEFLSMGGNDMHGAADGPSGVDAALRLAPDVALVDIGLPGFDGYEVARQIHARHGRPDMLLVALTGYGQPEDRERALKSGFDAHLVKPVNLDRLEKILADTRRPEGGTPRVEKSGISAAARE